MSVLKAFGYDETAEKADEVFPLGLMHYKRKKPGRVTFRITYLNPNYSMYSAEKGFENVKHFELDPESYAHFLRAYNASEGKIGKGFILGFQFIRDHAAGGDAEAAREVYTRFPDLEAERLKRAICAVKAGESELLPMFGQLTLHSDIFQQALNALLGVELADRLVFLKAFVTYVKCEHDQPRMPALRDYMAKTLCHVFPDVANSASAALAVDSVDFSDDRYGNLAYTTMVGMFTGSHKLLSESIPLPDNFAP